MTKRKVAIIGGGVSGLSAAWYLTSLLKDESNFEIHLFEREETFGGRTRSIEVGKGHIIDTGAGWLTTFYHSTLQLLTELHLDREVVLRTRNIRGAADLRLMDGTVLPLPLTEEQIRTSQLLTKEEQERLLAYLHHLCNSTQRASHPLDFPLQYDNYSAQKEYEILGQNVNKYVMTPFFEGPFFCQLSQLSAAMTNSWLSALLHPSTSFFQVDGGMNRICHEIASHLPNSITFHLSTAVSSVELCNENRSVRVISSQTTSNQSDERIYDAVIIATPTPNILNILHENAYPSQLPRSLLSTVLYTPHVRVYASLPSNVDVNIGYHLSPPIEPIATIEYFSSNHGAWGSCPPGRQWALICATSTASARYVIPTTIIPTHSLTDTLM
jgi:protoporphyrinogen oxidase